MLEGLKRNIFFSKLKHLKPALPKPVNSGWNMAANIAVLFDQHSEQDITDVKRLTQQLTAAGKKVHTLGYDSTITKKEIPAEGYYGLGQLSFVNIPSGDAVKEFTEYPADILIVLSSSLPLHFVYIISKSCAALKVGRYDDEFQHYFDLTVDCPKNISYRQLAEKYLQTLQILAQ